MSSVYLAGPITGLTYDEANAWRLETEQYFAQYGIQTRNPLRAKQFLQQQGTLETYGNADAINPLARDAGITARDRNDVMNSDVILANFLRYETVDVHEEGAVTADDWTIFERGVSNCGTPIEFGWADAYRKPVIMVMQAEGNPFDHGMMRSIAGFRVETLEEGLLVARSILV